MSEILYVSIFDNLWTSSFDTKCVHCTMEIPQIIPFPKIKNKKSKQQLKLKIKKSKLKTISCF